MFEVESCIRGYHVYGASWTPVIGEVLQCSRELGNREDPYAVAVHSTSNNTVGHVPRKISCICSLFIRRGGTLSCTVNGQRRRSEDLPQGGLEIPCILTFSGPVELLEKVRSRIAEILDCTPGKNSQSEDSQACKATVMALAQTMDVPVSKPELDVVEPQIFPVNKPGPEDVPRLNPNDPCESQPGDTHMKSELLDKVKKQIAEMLGGTSVIEFKELPTAQSKDEPPTQKPAELPIVLVEDGPVLPHQSVWLRFQDIALMNTDREIIENGEWFEDQHMNFSQRLLKTQFPHCNGLRLTCLQNQTHSLPTTNALQIMNIKDNHWIVGIRRGDTVHIYDSLYASLDCTDASMVQTNFRCRLGAIRHAKCPKQTGGSDCGPFAIAMATSLAFGEDPSDRQYSPCTVGSLFDIYCCIYYL